MECTGQNQGRQEDIIPFADDTNLFANEWNCYYSVSQINKEIAYMSDLKARNKLCT